MKFMITLSISLNWAYFTHSSIRFKGRIYSSINVLQFTQVTLTWDKMNTTWHAHMTLVNLWFFGMVKTKWQLLLPMDPLVPISTGNDKLHTLSSSKCIPEQWTSFSNGNNLTLLRWNACTYFIQQNSLWKVTLRYFQLAPFLKRA